VYSPRGRVTVGCNGMLGITGSLRAVRLAVLTPVADGGPKQSPLNTAEEEKQHACSSRLGTLRSEMDRLSRNYEGPGGGQRNGVGDVQHLERESLG